MASKSNLLALMWRKEKKEWERLIWRIFLSFLILIAENKENIEIKNFNTSGSDCYAACL